MTRVPMTVVTDGCISLPYPKLTRSKKFSPKTKKGLGMACHIPPLKKAKKQGEMLLPSLGPITTN